MELQNLFLFDARVYVAGVLIPTTELEIVSGFNAVPTCTVSLPPEPVLFGLGRLDRVPVQVFIRDSFSGTDEFLLLFEGEVVSTGYTSAPSAREFTISASGVLTFLRDMRILYTKSLQDDASAHATQQQVTTAVELRSEFTFPSSLFTHGIVNSRTPIRYPTEYLENVVEFIRTSGNGSPYAPYNDSTLAEFFARIADSVGLSSRVPRLPYLDDVGDTPFPLLAGLTSQATMALLSKMSGDGPNGGSLHDIINFVVSNMAYELAYLPAPALRDGKLASIALKPILYEALPPACNMVPASLVQSGLMYTEEVHGVPTRIRTKDLYNFSAMISQGSDNFFSRVGMLDYYPHGDGTADDIRERDTSNRVLLASEQLPSESHCGPVLYDASAPIWMSYVPTGSGEMTTRAELAEYKDRVLAHMLTLKQYDTRRLSFSTVFNPFLVAGFPGVVWDSEDSGLAFMGHIVTLRHSITRAGADTGVEMRFVRRLSEELNPDTRLHHSIESISREITHNADRMDAVYDRLLGCPAVSYDELQSLGMSDAQSSPADAYRSGFRDIVTFDDYCSFMEFTVEERAVIDDEPEVPFLLTGGRNGYLDDRKDPNLRTTLADMSRKAFANTVYAP